MKRRASKGLAWRFGGPALAVSCAAAVGFAVTAGCGPAPEPVPPRGPTTTPPTPATAAPAATATPAAAPTADASASPTAAPTAAATAQRPVGDFPPGDVCHNNPLPPHPFFGVLRNARCDQEMFLTMADTAGMLGVECKHCHAPHPTDPKKEQYPVMTPKKEVANWMSMHLMQAIKTKDGSPLKCKSCHTDDKGKPVAKILGNPRDPLKAQEWMTLVMVNKFVTLKGEKLKCKSCHIGNFTTKDWSAKVILRSDQIPPHEVPKKP